MTQAVFDKIENELKTHNAKYRVLDHPPSGLSHEVSLVREKLTGIPKDQLLKMAIKAMILKANGKLYQFNLAADKKIDFAKIKTILGVKPEFATPEEVKQITDCDVGEVPPFGNLFSIPVYADTSIATDEILFNAGMLTKTVFMQREDWIKIVKPIVKEFSK